jgi:hypothetical protein
LREQSARNRIVLEEAEIRRLQQGFTTIEELQSANAELIAQKTGFDSSVAQMIANIFSSRS